MEGEDPPEIEIPEEMRCAEVMIPVDHDNPEGRTTSLQVGTLPHTGEGQSRGAVLYVAGGPGGAGIPDLSQELETVAELREHFDVVAWNPRGVLGETVDLLPHDVCGYQGPGFVDAATQEEFDEVVAAHRAVMDECRDRDPELFDSMDTLQHVGDMESIRVALGEQKLNLYAQSHGGVRATAYADLHPERLESVVLDSIVDNVSDPESQETVFMTAMESQFAAFGQWCADNGECALHGQDVAEQWRELLTRAAEEPLPADGVSYGRAELSLMGGSLTRNEFSWEWLAEAIGSALENGDATRFQEVTGEIFYMPNLVAADVCADGRPFDDFAGYQEYTEFTVGLSENLGHGRSLNYLPCVTWPHEGLNPPGPIGTEGLPPFLFLASELEFPYSTAFVDDIPGSAAVKVEGTGHGLYFFEPSDCVIGHVHRYFVDGVLPEEDAFCETS
jgi:pimeloyl-ACP methyl ester carboxylesterase